MTMGASGDTEITLGTGKMLVLFFGLVALCAVFFGMGFSLGKSTVKTALVADVNSGSSTESGPRPSASKNLSSPVPSEPTVKPVGQKLADASVGTSATATAADSSSTPAASTSTPTEPVAAPSLNGYYVQVAAVSKQEDADALVDALKKKEYPAFVATPASDKLFRVQLGPFSDIKDAEGMRTKLIGDGYSPILKK